jgi:hypothetical protein
MDTITMVRVAAGVIAVVLLGIVIARRKRMATTKRVPPRR